MVPVPSRVHVHTVLILDLGLEGLTLLSGQRVDLAHNLALLIETHLQLLCEHDNVSERRDNPSGRPKGVEGAIVLAMIEFCTW